MDTFTHIAAERRAIADVLEGLDEHQWTADSLCDGWQVRHVAGHLTLLWNLPVPKFAFALVRHRGFHGANLHLSRELGERPKDDVVADLRAHAESRQLPPTMPPAGTLADVTIHGHDICVPLGLDHDVAPEARVELLDFMVSAKASAFRPRGILDGLRFVATDADWQHGEGPEVTGPTTDLAASLFGRRAVAARLDGDGASTYAARV